MNEVLLDSKNGIRIQKHSDTAYLNGVRKFAFSLDSEIRTEDPTRYTTMAMHESGDYAKYQLDNISQVAGHNIYSGWYGGTVDGFGKSLDKIHKERPEQIIFISEYGAEGEIQLNTEKPERMDYTGQYQRFYHESYIRQINQRPYLGGTAIWNEFDFSQPNIGGPTPHRNQKGLITWDRKPKDVYYLYKANWNPEPMVYIATRNWMIRGGESSAASTIDVYSNLSDITLYVNEDLQGKKKPDDVKKTSWQVHLKNGKNTITAEGKLNGKIYKDEVVIEYREYNTNLASQKTFHTISVNVGSNAQYLDPSGNIWIEDRHYNKGGFGFVSGNRQNFARTKVITNTHDVPLYYTSRDSLDAYRFDVRDGQYKVTLYFVENKNIDAGERIFDVNINDKTVIKNLDLAAEYGYAHAAKRSFVVNVDNGKGITVSFKPVKGNATLSGIKVEQ
jgi:beta-galactosidase